MTHKANQSDGVAPTRDYGLSGQENLIETAGSVIMEFPMLKFLAVGPEHPN